jgi:predicted dienelactone hydrolase
VRVVGLRVFELVDDSRPRWDGPSGRPVRAHVWYPAEADAPGSLVSADVFAPARVSVGADPAVEGAPVVLLSHGTGGSALSLGWLAEALAEAGSVVVGVDHHGNTASEPYLAEGFAFVWERPRDLSFALTWAADELGELVDVGSAGAAGFSLVGYTSAALLGARLDRARFAALLAGEETVAAPPEFPDLAEALRPRLPEDLSDLLAQASADARDERVRAAYAIAPALGPLVDAASVAAIDRPLAVRWGERDEIVEPAENAAVYARAPGADARPAGPVGHYVFLAECTELGRRTLPELCADPPGVDRAAVHRDVAADAVAFFEEALARQSVDM